MELKLNEYYRVTSDSRQYILQRFTGNYNEDGNEIRTNIGYYGTIKQLVRSLIEKEIKTSKISDLEALVKYVNDLSDTYESYLEFYIEKGMWPE